LKAQRLEPDSWLRHIHLNPDRRLGQSYKENTDFDGGVIRRGGYSWWEVRGGGVGTENKMQERRIKSGWGRRVEWEIQDAGKNESRNEGRKNSVGLLLDAVSYGDVIHRDCNT
jgi:hypothetical protein